MSDDRNEPEQRSAALARADATATLARTPGGQWSKGVSGNPRGRPLGTRNSTTVAAAERLRAHAERLVEKLLAKADSSDEWVSMNAIRIALEKLDLKTTPTTG